MEEKKKFVVGVVGTQNTGKSTFIKNLIEKFKHTPMEFKMVGCDYRKKIEEKGLKINRNGNLESQKIIFDTLVEQLDIIDKMPDGYYITDRSPLDAYVYTCYLWEHGQLNGVKYDELNMMYDKLCAEMGRYDRVVYIDLDKCDNVEVVDDKFRDTNLEYRKEIDGLFKGVIESLECNGVLRGKVERNIFGTREERVEKFIDLVGARGIFDASMDKPCPLPKDENVV